MLVQSPAVPPHVPPARVYEFDFLNAPVGLDDPYPQLARELQAGAEDIFYTPLNGGHWVVQNAELAVQMLRETEIFSSDPKYNETRRFNPTLLPSQADPPAHGEYRKVLGAYFAPGNVKKLEPAIRAIGLSLIDKVKDRGGCEFVGEIGEAFPISVFLRLVGARDEDAPELLEYAGMFTRFGDVETRTRATEGLARYIRRLYDERRANPGDDLLSRIVTAGYEGRPLTDDELSGLGVLLFLAGLDTVKSVMSFVMLYLGRNPERYAELVRDPGSIPAAVEELMRISGAAMPERAVSRDVDYAGVQLKAGDRVLFVLPLISFDQQLNKDPYRVAFDREISQHIIFGAGPHRCAGSHLARIEIRILLEEWTRHFPQFELDPDRGHKVTGGTTWTPEEVWLRWQPDTRH